MKQIQTERQWVGESELKWHSKTKKQLGRHCTRDALGPLGMDKFSTILIFISRCATPNDWGSNDGYFNWPFISPLSHDHIKCSCAYIIVMQTLLWL